MPGFNGEQVFGTAVRMRRKRTERAAQRNNYGGLDGTEKLDMGARGHVTTVTGRFVCEDAASLNAAFLLLESYMDENLYVLTDQYGNNWPNVTLIEVEPDGELNQTFPYGGYTQRYKATFEHLTP